MFVYVFTSYNLLINKRANFTIAGNICYKYILTYRNRTLQIKLKNGYKITKYIDYNNNNNKRVK